MSALQLALAPGSPSLLHSGQKRMSLLDHLDHHPWLTRITTGSLGLTGLWTMFSDFHPSVKGAAGVLGGALMLFAGAYKPARKALRAVREYAAGERAAAERRERELKLLVHENKGMRHELDSNTRLTQQMLAEVTRTHRTLEEQGDTRDMMVSLEAKMEGLHQNMLTTQVHVKESYDRIRVEFNGLGESLRKRVDQLDKTVEERFAEIDERVRRLEKK